MPLEKAAVRCRVCGSIEVGIVDTAKTEEGNYHGAVCVNGHPLLLLTVLVRQTRSPWIRWRFRSLRIQNANSHKVL